MWIVTVVQQKNNELNVIMNSEELGNLGFVTLLNSYNVSTAQEDFAFSTEFKSTSWLKVSNETENTVISWKRV